MHDGNDRITNCRCAVKVSPDADSIRSSKDPMGHSWWHDAENPINSMF
jgi:hypothetical protein